MPSLKVILLVINCIYKKMQDVKWTYVSPAGDFQAEGARTGDYILGGEELTLNSKGQSVISYARKGVSANYCAAEVFPASMHRRRR